MLWLPLALFALLTPPPGPGEGTVRRGDAEGFSRDRRRHGQPAGAASPREHRSGHRPFPGGSSRVSRPGPGRRSAPGPRIQPLSAQQQHDLPSHDPGRFFAGNRAFRNQPHAGPVRRHPLERSLRRMGLLEPDSPHGPGQRGGGPGSHESAVREHRVGRNHPASSGPKPAPVGRPGRAGGPPLRRPGSGRVRTRWETGDIWPQRGSWTPTGSSSSTRRSGERWTRRPTAGSRPSSAGSPTSGSTSASTLFGNGAATGLISSRTIPGSLSWRPGVEGDTWQSRFYVQSGLFKNTFSRILPGRSQEFVTARQEFPTLGTGGIADLESAGTAAGGDRLETSQLAGPGAEPGRPLRPADRSRPQSAGLAGRSPDRLVAGPHHRNLSESPPGHPVAGRPVADLAQLGLSWIPGSHAERALSPLPRGQRPHRRESRSGRGAPLGRRTGSGFASFGLRAGPDQRLLELAPGPGGERHRLRGSPVHPTSTAESGAGRCPGSSSWRRGCRETCPGACGWDTSTPGRR